MDNYHVQPQQETLRVLNLSKVYTIFHETKYQKARGHGNFLNVTQHTITFEVRQKIEYMLHKIHESDENIKIRKYYYYLDEVNGNLYILSIVSNDANTNDRDEVDFYIFECNIKQSRASCKIIAYSGPCDTKTFTKGEQIIQMP